MVVRFENVGHVFLKLVDADVEVLPSENGVVHVDAKPENAFTIKRNGNTLKVLTSTGWKLRNLPKKEKKHVRLTIQIPDGVSMNGGMKRVSLRARGIRFDSLAIGEATAELDECEVRSLTVGPSRVKASLHVAGKTRIAVSMGSAEVNVLTLEGDMDVSTVMGSLVLRLPEDCDATIEVAGEGGEVVLNSGGLLGSGEHRILISNVKGAVIVDLWGDSDEV